MREFHDRFVICRRRLQPFVLVGVLLLLQPEGSHAQASIRDLDNPGRQSFQVELRQLNLPASGESESFQVAEVPPGTRLVIEHVSFKVRSLEARAPGIPPPRFGTFAVLVTTVNGVSASHELLTSRIDLGDGSMVSAASQPIRAYADPASPVLVRIGGLTRDRSAPLQIAHLTVSGHLVDLP